MDTLVPLLLIAIMLIVVPMLRNSKRTTVLPLTPPEPYKIREFEIHKPKVEAQPKADPLIASAKSTLQSLGFPAAEAAKLLSGIKAATVEEYVSQALQKVKI